MFTKVTIKRKNCGTRIWRNLPLLYACSVAVGNHHDLPGAHCGTLLNEQHTCKTNTALLKGNCLTRWPVLYTNELCNFIKHTRWPESLTDLKLL